ncbi:MAG: hypothetical protein WAT19_06600 [Ferruginibacter sp.]
MTQLKLNDKGEFVVKESIGVNLVIGLVFMAMFITAFFGDDAVGNIPFWKRLNAMHITIIPAFIFFVKAFKQQTKILLNDTGFFYQGRLLTHWDDFIEASIVQDEVLMSIQDNFKLLVKHYKNKKTRIYSTKIPLGNTQNQSEEAVLAAVQYFCTKNQPNSGKR